MIEMHQIHSCLGPNDSSELKANFSNFASVEL